MPVIQKFYILLCGCLLIALGGCTSVEIREPVYSAAVISRADLLSGEALFGKKVNKSALPEDNVMEVTDEMRAYLARYVPKNHVETVQVHNLLRMMIGKGTMGMEYDPAKTHTAQEAFRKAEGNCLAFSYLFAAFAREVGLKVSFQEVAIPPTWDEISDELFYFSRHVNIRVHMKEFHDYVIDIDRVNYKSHYRTWELSDDNAAALYYSNKGTDYLAAGDVKKAFLYLVKALELAPREAAIWSNLGVLYRLNGRYGHAEKAYFIGLKYDSQKRSILSNLSVLYESMGEAEKASYYAELALAHQMKNPYYRYYKAIDAFEAGDYDLALTHLKKALATRDDEQKFHRLLGNTYARLGDEARASRAWKKARELSDLN